MEQETKQPKARYNIGSYATVCFGDGKGCRGGQYILQVAMPRRIVLGRPLVVRELPYSLDRTIELGIVREVRDYVKRDHIEIRTDSGWYYIERNICLEIDSTDTFHWCEVWEETHANI